MWLKPCTIAALHAILPLLVTTLFAEEQRASTNVNLSTRKNGTALVSRKCFKKDRSGIICSFLFNVTRLKEIAGDSRSKFGKADAKDLFIDDPAVGDYFDTIAEAAGFLEVALRARAEVTSCASLAPCTGRDMPVW